MIFKSPLCFVFLWMVLLLIGGCISKRTWYFEILSASSYSSDESMLNVSVRLQQMSRQGISVSVVFDWKFDADETTMIEAYMYSCYSGNEQDFRMLPYRVQYMRLFDFFNSFYNTIVYANVANCSNFPNFSKGFKPPLPQDTYKIDNCWFTGDGLPDILTTGYYKLLFKYSGQVNASLLIASKVMANNMIHF